MHALEVFLLKFISSAISNNYITCSLCEINIVLCNKEELDIRPKRIIGQNFPKPNAAN